MKTNMWLTSSYAFIHFDVQDNAGENLNCIYINIFIIEIKNAWIILKNIFKTSMWTIFNCFVSKDILINNNYTVYIEFKKCKFKL